MVKRLSTSYIIYIFLVVFPLPAQPRSTGYPDLDLYYSQLDKNRFEADVARRRYLMETIPHDKFIMDYMERGREVFNDTVSLFSFFSYGPVISSKEERL